MPEVFCEWHEAESVEDHAPYASLHDALAAYNDRRRCAGRSASEKAAFVAVEVVRKA